jgi:hypothetical protein
LHPFDLLTGFAFPAGFSGSGRIWAAQSLGEMQRQAAPTHTGRSSEKVGMLHGIMSEMLLKHLYCPFVSKKVPISGHYDK